MESNADDWQYQQAGMVRQFASRDQCHPPQSPSLSSASDHMRCFVKVTRASPPSPPPVPAPTPAALARYNIWYDKDALRCISSSYSSALNHELKQHSSVGAIRKDSCTTTLNSNIAP